MAKKSTGATHSPQKTSVPSAESPGKAAAESQRVEKVPLVCPLCTATHVTDPVVLHSSAGKVCIACASCAENWRSLCQCSPSSLFCPLCQETVIEVADPFLSWTPNATTAPANVTLGGAPPSGAAGADPADSMCGICEEAAGTMECVECKFPLCNTCHSESHSKGRYKTHQVIALGSAPTAATAVRNCHLHPSNSLDLYCETCQQCICLHCCFSVDTHKGHKATPISSIVQQVIDATTEAMTDLSAQARKAVELQQKLDASKPAIEEKRESLLHTIQSFFQQVRTAIDEREAMLKDEVDHSLSSTSTAVQQQAELLLQTNRQAQALIQASGSLLEGGHPVDIMMMQKMIGGRVDQLFGQLRAVEGGDGYIQQLLAPLSDVRFTPSISGHVASMEQLCGVLQQAGRVGLPPPPPPLSHASSPPSNKSTTNHKVPPKHSPQAAAPSPLSNPVPAVPAASAPRSRLMLPTLALATDLIGGGAGGKDDDEMEANPVGVMHPVPVSSRKRYLSIGDDGDVPPRKAPGSGRGTGTAAQSPPPPTAGSPSSSAGYPFQQQPPSASTTSAATTTATMAPLSSLFFPQRKDAAQKKTTAGDGKASSASSGLQLRI